MWTLYMCFAEGGFRAGRNDDVQMLIAKPGFVSATGESLQPEDLSLTQPAGKAPGGISPG